MKTVTVFEESRLEMDSFGDQWTDWQAIIEDPKSSLKQKNFATKKMDVVSTMIGKYFKEDGYDRIVTDKFEFVWAVNDPNKESVECNPLPRHVH
mgnify:CR=1 FL=1|tara:strand:- start:232 stop:513 length:282 start_codon:yes stop_codon:yes gene_type:complete